jgi:tRNA (guanine37-N1)-methyltransferase
MRFDIVTIFPAFFSGPLDYGIVRRAREAGIIDVSVHDLRDFALVMDAVTRLLPGALGNQASVIEESFSARGPVPAGRGELPARLQQAHSVDENSPESVEPLLLDYPHYTRPAEFRGWSVPDILMGGNHEEIRRWRRQMALEKTRRNRPDLLIEKR